MKRTAKFLSLAIVLFAGLSGTAQAEGFKIGTDLVSSYVWRGSDIGDAPAIQPALNYTFKDSGIIVGFWGSYAVNANTPSVGTAAGSNYRYQETDFYATVPAGPFSLTLTNYYIPVNGGDSNAFAYKSSGPNTAEASVAYAKDDLSLLAAINFAGNTYNYSKYIEADYKAYDKDGYTGKVFVGAGNELQYAINPLDQKNGFNVVNVGFSVSKERFTGSYAYNPDTKKATFVFMASF